MRIQAEDNLSALIESSDDPIWSVDRQHRLLTFNSALQRHIERNFGVRAAVGMRPCDFPPQAGGDAWAALYDRAFNEGAYRTEFRISTGRVLELSFNPILINGRREGVSAFSKDVTQQRESEAALRAAEKRYRDIFDGAIEGMYRTSLIDDSRCVNLAFATMLGYQSPAELLAATQASPDDSWADPGERGKFLAALERDHEVLGFECQLKRKDGSLIWVEINSRIACDKDGKPVTHQGFVKDISERKRAAMAFRENEQRFRATFEQAAIGIVHCSFTGEIIACNPHFAGIVGYTQQELTGMNVRQITPPGFMALTEEMLKLLHAGIAFPCWEKPYFRKDGSLTWVRLTASTQRDDDGRALHLITFVQDINAQKIAEQALKESGKALEASEARYRTVFQTILDPVAISRVEDGMFIEVNEAFEKVMGFPRDEVIGRTSVDLNIWVDLSDRKRMADALTRDRCLRDTEIRIRRKNGEVFWGLLSASLMHLDGVPFLLSVTRDISAVKAAEDTIRDLAFYDPLTHLPNRRLLLDRLQQALTSGVRSPRKLALLFVDLDNFKTLNDALGHHCGDSLLREVARRLAATIRESDTVARLGGDEFAVMLHALSGSREDAAAQAKAVGEKIFAALGKTYRINGREVHNHPSIGVTVFGTPHHNPVEILQQAEIAMFQAKEAGGNTLRFFSPALQAVVNERAKLEEDLLHAIKAEQFELYYQPQVDSAGLIGAEVLIRWNHPTRGVLLPGDFIPLAEETGLILRLGNWTLESACAQLAGWSDRWDKPRFEVAVNISAREFRQADFVEQVLAALKRTGAKPMTLKLELTESMLVEDIDDVIAKMTELRAHGLSFSLDDFGTGYSSLSYLKRLPLDQLKIDRAFVRDILEDVSSGAIAQTIISLGKAMGLSVVAEGVETEEQRDFLMGLGCSCFQGYLFGRPLPVKEFERLWMDPTPSGVSISKKVRNGTHP
ncbi:MAG: EAL domain-containing protein [Terracidiphilus sp.]